MTRSLPRIAAAAVLAAGGALVAITVFGLVVAKFVIASGVPISPADAALLDDLIQLAPFMAAFAAASLVAAFALLTGRDWAHRLATAIATVATSIGAFAIVLVVLGHDPFTNRTSMASAADGLGILAFFTGLYAAVLVALSFSATSERPAPAHPLAA
jgi:hypothetical protein